MRQSDRNGILDKSKIQNTASDLRTINEWIKKRLSGLEHEDVVTLQKEFVREKIHEIKNIFGVNTCRLVTLRSGFRVSQDYLRPVYSFPSILKPHFEAPEFQKPFSYKYEVESNFPFDGLEVYPKLDALPPEVFSAVVKISSVEKNKNNGKTEELAPGDDPNLNFKPRINGFWNSLLHSKDKQIRDIYISPKDNNLFCFFAGARKGGDTNIGLKNLIAIYFDLKDSRLNEGSDEQLKKADVVVRNLFAGIEIISNIDARLFALEGLQLVTDLIPIFYNEELAQADKIAFALESMNKLLSNHAIGRYDESESPKIYYMNTLFRKNGNLFIPRLDLYPAMYRRQYRIASCQIAHAHIPSASKFLLLNYLFNSKIKIVFGRSTGSDNDWIDARFDENSYSELLTNLHTAPVEEWLYTVWDQKKPDILRMDMYDSRWDEFSSTDTKSPLNTPWNALNKAASTERVNKSIVAFVVEGDRLSKKENTEKVVELPRGIFAIESTHVDAFSDSDVVSIKEVLVALSSLVRAITHKNSRLDYRYALANAFNVKLPTKKKFGTGDECRRLLLLAHTIDALELKELLTSIAPSKRDNEKEGYDWLWKNLGLSRTVYTLVLEIKELFEAIPDNSTEDEKNAEIDNRLVRIREWLCVANDKSDKLPQAIEFLESCTENILWTNFLSSIGQALGDRVNDELPKFYLMRPGYSASRIFMAGVDGEIQQVVKLSSAEKLKKERRRYLDFVRYKVVNAARVPVNAFSFDTAGTQGRNIFRKDVQNFKDEPYGVLVSDLVSGIGTDQNEVVTLLALLANQIHMRAEGDEDNLKSIKKFEDRYNKLKNAVNNLFKKDITLWRIDLDKNIQYEEGMDGISIARQSFRLPEVFGFNIDGDQSMSHAFNQNDNSITERNEKRSQDLYGTNGQYRAILKNDGLTEDLLENSWDGNFAYLMGTDMGLDVEAIKKARFVTHGDLNSRNLTWASGLDALFMIDFEHVGVGVRGTDQLRLIVNTTTEIFSAYLEEHPESIQNEQHNMKILKAITVELDSAITLIGKVARSAIKGNSTAIKNIAKQQCKELIEDGLCEPEFTISNYIVDIFSTMLSGGNTNKARQNYNRFWGYCLFCSALKEFEYSCRSIKPDIRNDLLKAANRQQFKILGSSSEELTQFLISALTKESLMLDDNLGRYMRHFTAAKVLNTITTESAPTMH